MPPKKIAQDNNKVVEITKPIKKEEITKKPVKVVIKEPVEEEEEEEEEEITKKPVKVVIEEEEEEEEITKKVVIKDVEEEEEKVEKRKRETFEDLVKIINTGTESKKKLDDEIQEIEKTLKLKKIEQAKVDKNILKTLSLLGKSHTKKKQPREGPPVKTGFNKEHPVPKQLLSFLGLEEGTEMSRPKVYSAFSTKCKEMGLKDGKNTTLNEEAVELLGLPKSDVGKTMLFTEVQSFLSTLYPKKTLVSSSASDNLAVEDDE
jgi:hypothetical protein